MHKYGVYSYSYSYSIECRFDLVLCLLTIFLISYLFFSYLIFLSLSKKSQSNIDLLYLLLFLRNKKKVPTNVKILKNTSFKIKRNVSYYKSNFLYFFCLFCIFSIKLYLLCKFITRYFFICLTLNVSL